MFQELLPDLCSNFQDSLVFSFVYMATGENYADIAEAVLQGTGQVIRHSLTA